MSNEIILHNKHIPLNYPKWLIDLLAILLGLIIAIIISSIRYFFLKNTDNSINYLNILLDIVGLPTLIIGPLLTLLAEKMLCKFIPSIKDKNLSFFVRFKTTVGLSAIIINKKNEILLIKSSKDNNDFYKQPGTRYRINDFNRLISRAKKDKNFPSPISKLLETIKDETKIVATNLELLYFFDGFEKLNLAVNSKGESLQNEIINKNYKDNYILPPPFLIEMQDRNNIATGVSTMDLFYAFTLKNDLENNDPIVFKNKDEIQRIIDNDINNDTISIHHDIAIIINKFYKMLTQSKPKIIYSTCRYSMHITNIYQQLNTEVIDINDSAKNIHPKVSDEVFVLKNKKQEVVNLDNFKKCLNKLSNSIQKIIIDIKDMPKINDDININEWNYFKAEKRINLLQIYHSSSVMGIKETKEKLNTYCDCIEYIINFNDLLIDGQLAVNNCKGLLIKQMRVLYDSNVEEIEKVHRFISIISETNESNYKIYSWLDRIIFVSKECFENNCTNCKSK